MNEVSVEVRSADPAVPAPATRWHRAELLVPCFFLLTAIGLTAMIWASPAARVPTNANHFESDIYLNIWFMRYVATALAHGHLPALVTTALNAPQGVNVMWNTSLLLPGMVLAPVTLLAGPTVSLAILLTAGFAGSASAMYLVLRRWGASIGAAVVGGALYGFSPAILVAAEDHYHLQFAVLPPLIIDAAFRLVTGRGRPLLTGAWLGVLLTAQIFIAEELLTDTAIAGLIALVVLVASRPSAIHVQRLRAAAAGTAIAIGVTLLICGRALWVQFRGPLTEHGSPWRPETSGIHPGGFVTAPPADLLHGNFNLFLRANHQQPMETMAYLGWPLLVAVLAATVVFWRDLRIRVAGVTFFLFEWLGMGSHRFAIGGWHPPLPGHLLLHLPLLGQVMPDRFPILADGAAAAVLAFAIDRARRAIPVRQAWRLPVIAAATAAVLVPVIPALVPATPVLPVPAGWQQVVTGLQLSPGASVLVLPVDPFRAGRANAMLWQAMTGEQISLVGGYCIAPAPGGKAVMCGAAETQTYPQHATLSAIYGLAQGSPGARGPTRAMLAVAIRSWHPTAIIMAAQGSHPGLASYLTSVLGPPAIRQGSVLGWRIAQLMPLLSSYSSCAKLRQFSWSPCGSHLGAAASHSRGA